MLKTIFLPSQFSCPPPVSPHPTQPPPHTCPTPLLLYLLFRFLTINLFLDVWSPASRLVLLLLLLLVWGHVIRVCAFQPSRIPSQVSCRCARCRLRSGNCFNLFYFICSSRSFLVIYVILSFFFLFLFFVSVFSLFVSFVFSFLFFLFFSFLSYFCSLVCSYFISFCLFLRFFVLYCGLFIVWFFSSFCSFLYFFVVLIYFIFLPRVFVVFSVSWLVLFFCLAFVLLFL